MNEVAKQALEQALEGHRGNLEWERNALVDYQLKVAEAQLKVDRRQAQIEALEAALAAAGAN